MILIINKVLRLTNVSLFVMILYIVGLLSEAAQCLGAVFSNKLTDSVTHYLYKVSILSSHTHTHTHRVLYRIYYYYFFFGGGGGERF